jgi:hypothetical protein
MKMKARMIAAVMTVVLVLAAFPIGAGAAHYYPCNRAQFIRDVTVPDGSHFAPGDTFTKTWRVRNTGSCTWTAADYTLVLTDGNDFGVANSHALTADVPPWSYANLTITGMTAPATTGRHRSYWKLDNGNGQRFGVGWGGGVAIFADIDVVTPPSVTYDFEAEAEAGSAVWTSGVPGSLTFPGTPGDSIGSVYSDPDPHFENNVTASNPGLVVSPNNAYNGFIEGYFSDGYTVKRGDRFQTTVGCEYGSTFCYVAFSLKYQIGSGPIYTLWTFRERYEGLTYSANVNLDRLAGQTVNFILHVSAYGSPVGDSAIWGHPVIVGTGSSSGPGGPGGPGGPSTSGWNTYSHTSPEIFQFKFPPSASVSSTGDVIRFPAATPGTNLLEKRLEVKLTPPPSSGDCVSSISGVTDTSTVTVNGMTFTKERGNYSGASPNENDWVAYSTEHTFGSGSTANAVCISFSLTLLHNPSSSSPAYNFDNESALLDQIIETLSFPSGGA